MESRQKIITEFRRNKPIAELERKWEKAKGRHSNRYWCAEWLDLAHARAIRFAELFNGKPGSDGAGGREG